MAAGVGLLAGRDIDAPCGTCGCLGYRHCPSCCACLDCGDRICDDASASLPAVSTEESA